METSGLISFLLVTLVSLSINVNAVEKKESASPRQDFGALANNYVSAGSSSFGTDSNLGGFGDNNNNYLSSLLSSSSYYQMPSVTKTLYAKPSMVLPSSNNWNPTSSQPLYSMYPNVLLPSTGYGSLNPAGHSLQSSVPMETSVYDGDGLWAAIKRFFDALFSGFSFIPALLFTLMKSIFLENESPFVSMY